MDILAFLAGRLITKAFWGLVGVTFVIAMMTMARMSYRNLIYQAAAKTVGKRF